MYNLRHRSGSEGAFYTDSMTRKYGAAIYEESLSEIIHKLIDFYWLLSEMCSVFNLKANVFQLYKGQHHVS